MGGGTRPEATGTLGWQGAGWAVLPDGAGGQVHTHRAFVASSE